MKAIVWIIEVLKIMKNLDKYLHLHFNLVNVWILKSQEKKFVWNFS